MHAGSPVPGDSLLAGDPIGPAASPGAFAGVPGWPPQVPLGTPPSHRPDHGVRHAVTAAFAVLVILLGVLATRTTSAWLSARNGVAPVTGGSSSPAPGTSGGTPAGAAPSSGAGTSVPAPITAPGASALTAADVAAVVAAVDPAVVDITSQLGLASSTVAGTGMVLTSSGEILTNNHVVNGATSISAVDIGDGHTYNAVVVGTDPTDDVAVLQLDGASGLATVGTGDSSRLVTGQGVVAIGNAWGAGGAPHATSGPITALVQAITATDQASHSSEHLNGLIETAAALQPGDSGGPLVDARGRVVGMDTAEGGSFQIQSSSGDGYAIPINRALAIARQIVAGAASPTIHIGTPAFLGVEVQASAGGSGSGVTSTPGASVVIVEPSSPLDALGLLPGDVIVSLGGTPVDSPATLRSLLERYQPGDTVDVGWTDLLGLRHVAPVTLVAGPAD
jgi:S1-C subfamily serine protease